MTETFEAVAAAERSTLTESEAKELLADHGLSVPDSRLVRSPEAAVDAATDIGYPVVAKVSSPAVQHKSEWAGGRGVAVGLESPEAVRDAAAAILEAIDEQGIEGSVLVEAGVDLEAGIEVIVGGTRDPSFGPTVLLGLGGVAVELLEDTTHRIAPISHAEAVEMTYELSSSPLFDGYRGGPTVDRDAIAETIQTVSELLAANEDIADVEINPLLAREDAAIALDALITRTDGD
ncbi:acetyl-CoA synthetase I subunit beta [Halostagnicola sp. A56]|uniref:acetate--CoA ligase family protein n=1 Tax=Halostagnicola sp. A56 TaxID=1495067 RepID=UPI0004A07D7F|nr:acetate--CoA ligase family protein [Halostagnicola sp. A56]KDE59155.1 acetyl-CoA synthetase I subunit beta [Halostagnicola sp. A56]